MTAVGIYTTTTLFLKDHLLRMQGDLKKKERSVTILIISSAIAASICFFILKNIDPVVKVLVYFCVVGVVAAILAYTNRQSVTVAIESTEK
jgi:hypothetical protein